MSGRRAPLVAAVLAAAVLAPVQGHAQARNDGRYPARPVDFDAAEEQHSEFWERAAHPHRERYRQYLDAAVDFMSRNSPDGDGAALDALQRAIALASDEPDAHWLLATLHWRREQWPQCVAGFARVAEIDAMYRPPAGYLPLYQDQHLADARRAALDVALDVALNLALGICHQRRGEFAEAAVSYHRILVRDMAGDDHDVRPLREYVYRRLGESRMALGQLREAIESLQLATHERPRALTYYSLAVAYDRDEQSDRAREALAVALKRDSRQRSLRHPDNWLAPDAERFYYRALTRLARAENAHAVVYFRHYLHAAGTAGWSRRAREHLRRLGSRPLLTTAQVHAGGAKLDLDEVLRAVDRVSDELQQCMSEAPGLLLEVRITAVDKPRARRRRSRSRTRRLLSAAPREQLRAGVKSAELHVFDTPPETVQRVRQCVENTAERIVVPAPKGGSESYRWVRFPLVSVPVE